MRMDEKTGTGVSSEKEKVKESQPASRSVTPPLDIHFGYRVGGVTWIVLQIQLKKQLRVLTQEIKGCSLRILLNMSEVRVMPPTEPNEALLRISQDMACDAPNSAPGVKRGCHFFSCLL